MTVIFEFGFGHYVAGHSWSHLLADYNLLAGRVWFLFLIWIALLPYVIWRLGKR
jgi:apolipoprotein N-acyltransferase